MGRNLASRPSVRPTLPITPFHLFVATTSTTTMENLKNVTNAISSPVPNSIILNLKPNSLMAAATSEGLMSTSDFTDLILVVHHSVSLQPHKSDLLHTRPTYVPMALAPILHLLPVELAGIATNPQNVSSTFAPIATALVTPLPAKPLPASAMVAGHNFIFCILVITIFAAALCYWADIPLVGSSLVGACHSWPSLAMPPLRTSSANEPPLEASLSTTGTAMLHPSTRRHITTSGRRFNRLPWRRVVD
ncbi:hypothetical protein FPV67DRAFT_1504140 [Lyophyllum atratum]|nr:hypothetical protein FPV67DRAFT_1504140 [Lyophyllum atratum]